MGYFACDGIFSHLYTILINFIKPKVYRSLKIIMVNVNNSFSGIIFKDKCWRRSFEKTTKRKLNMDISYKIVILRLNLSGQDAKELKD